MDPQPSRSTLIHSLYGSACELVNLFQDIRPFEARRRSQPIA
jgi:hypothetical protein